MINKENSKVARRIRHYRIRNKISGTAERPRLCVYRSLKHIYAQLIDDEKMVTLASASTLDKNFKGKYGGNKEAARAVGELVARRAKIQGIERVVFDRGGCVYHGRVAMLADGARAGGLNF